MARSSHIHGSHPKMRSVRSAQRAAIPIVFLLIAVLIALWVAGEPVDSLLPVAPPG